MIIPPQLKILAGFKADEDVTIDQIISALEKQNLRQKPTSTSEKTDVANQAAEERSRGARFQSLMSNRQQEFPNESYEDRFSSITHSKEGQRLFAQMHRPEIANQSSIPAENANRANVGDSPYRTSEQARQAFLAEVEKLVNKGLDRDTAWATAAHHEPGASAWKFWKIAAQKEKNLPTVHRMPPPTPAAAHSEFAD